jgi:acylphosphatase
MNEALRACRKFRVSGKVQGVHFRVATRECARRLGLDGWVSNLADGRVEAVAAGPTSALTQFAQWLAQGPDRAAVTAVTSEVCEEPLATGFEVR